MSRTCDALSAEQRLWFFRVFARAGVQSRHLEDCVTLYRDRVRWLDDDLPVVADTVSPAVEEYLTAAVARELPEWMSHE